MHKQEKSESPYVFIMHPCALFIVPHQSGLIEITSQSVMNAWDWAKQTINGIPLI